LSVAEVRASLAAVASAVGNAALIGGVRRIGPRCSAAFYANCLSADATVLNRSIVTVIGPTPPGTGVM